MDYCVASHPAGWGGGGGGGGRLLFACELLSGLSAIAGNSVQYINPHVIKKILISHSFLDKVNISPLLL